MVLLVAFLFLGACNQSNKPDQGQQSSNNQAPSSSVVIQRHQEITQNYRNLQDQLHQAELQNLQQIMTATDNNTKQEAFNKMNQLLEMQHMINQQLSDINNRMLQVAANNPKSNKSDQIWDNLNRQYTSQLRDMQQQIETINQNKQK